MSNTVQQYAIPLYDAEFLANNIENVQFTINDSLFFEMLLLNIRSETVSYSKSVSKAIRKQENDLIKKDTRV